jgi:hypothetical protein
MVQTSTLDKDLNDSKYVNIKCNFPFDMYIFRSTVDFNNYELPWINKLKFENTQTYMQFKGAKNSDGDLRAVKKTFTSVNGTVVTLGGNSEGYDPGTMESMYSVLVKLVPTVDPPPYQFAKKFDREKFFQLFWQFAIVDVIFFSLVYHFMKYKVNMRVDRIAAWISQQTFEGKERNILAGLLLSRDDRSPNDPSNAEFRRNIYWVEQSIKILIATPFVILFSFGLCCATLSEPRTLGFALVLVGYPLATVFGAMYIWKNQGYRMTKSIILAVVLSFISIQIFTIVAVFIDPAVSQDGESVDIFSITTVLLTLNTLPMMAIAYINDPALAKSMQDLTSMLSTSKNDIKNKFDLNYQHHQARSVGACDGGLSKWLRYQFNKFKMCCSCSKPPENPYFKSRKQSISEKNLKNVLGDEYSISSEDNTFQYSNPIDSAVSGTNQQRKRRSILLYIFALFNLVLYISLVSNFADVRYSPQSYGYAVWILILDFCMWLRMKRGTCEWGPGKTVLLIAMTRGALSLFSGDLWLVGIGKK